MKIVAKFSRDRGYWVAGCDEMKESWGSGITPDDALNSFFSILLLELAVHTKNPAPELRKGWKLEIEVVPE